MIRAFIRVEKSKKDREAYNTTTVVKPKMLLNALLKFKKLFRIYKFHLVKIEF